MCKEITKIIIDGFVTAKKNELYTCNYTCYESLHSYTHALKESMKIIAIILATRMLACSVRR